ncbi:rhomboid family intramembrane serine protease [Nonlabens ulvanivorans]|uniref:Membrane associated rhomboid family serine protease n=1 Tax=Nonlabens ulvanivorans TaxID=906888 RepID=A0A084JVR5_NONUL|nr:rhomboid family intramembrane serine protease [Nonlabens ulvanivorans]KEZ93049.1 hypothetical protein IL45_13045 [Nonlabens ulvanivorans]PRX12721.1 membrane associated rhomboid family serine protease [Nonlabens ulvanivorans]GAK94450.1 rhomboid family protein [Nonlabens ulvanivorans]
MFSNMTPVVKGIIILNVVFYVGTVFIAPGLYDTFALHFFEDPRFQIWQPISHMFMHDSANFLHILMNMYVLAIFGPPLERWMGNNKFIFFYLSSGIGAYLLTTGIDYYEYITWTSEAIEAGATQAIVDQQLFGTASNPNFWGVMVGASGCTFGVLAGFAFLYPNVKLQILFIPFPIAAKWLIGAYFAYETIATLGITGVQDNIGHAAHVGGAIVGFIITWYWKRNSMDKYRWD